MEAFLNKTVCKSLKSDKHVESTLFHTTQVSFNILRFTFLAMLLLACSLFFLSSAQYYVHKTISKVVILVPFQTMKHLRELLFKTSKG